MKRIFVVLTLLFCIFPFMVSTASAGVVNDGYGQAVQSGTAVDVTAADPAPVPPGAADQTLPAAGFMFAIAVVASSGTGVAAYPAFIGAVLAAADYFGGGGKDPGQ